MREEQFVYVNCDICGAKIREGDEASAPNGITVSYHRHLEACVRALQRRVLALEREKEQ